MCVYSEEIQENKGKQISRENALEDAIFDKPTVNGTLVHITAIFGFTLSGLVIRDIGEQIGMSV